VYVFFKGVNITVEGDKNKVEHIVFDDRNTVRSFLQHLAATTNTREDRILLTQPDGTPLDLNQPLSYYQVDLDTTIIHVKSVIPQWLVIEYRGVENFFPRSNVPFSGRNVHSTAAPGRILGAARSLDDATLLLPKGLNPPFSAKMIGNYDDDSESQRIYISGSIEYRAHNIAGLSL
jgi:hypothetical protein